MSVLVLAVVLPVVIRGAPLSDDYHNCVRPTEVGYSGFLSESLDRLGAVRPARFVEIFTIGPLCDRVPFGIVILVPLVLTALVAVLLCGLLRDLGLPTPWPQVGASIYLLQPLGAEAGLWPSALHVPLGLALALLALRLHRAGHHVWATAAGLGACLSVEQAILALPVAVWLVTPADRRRRWTAVTAAVSAAVTVAYALWPGTDPRSAVSLAERISAVWQDPIWYLRFPAAGLGAHSVPLAIWWAFPISVVVLSVSIIAGARFGPLVLSTADMPARSRAELLRSVIAVVALVALVNLPLVTTVPRGNSPRTFTPTWLILAAVAAVVAARARWRRPRLAGAVGAGAAAGALLSIALSVSVRLDSADFTETSSTYLATQLPNGGTVEVCGIRRTVASPAPVGSFALHELMYDWSARDAVRYYTGRDIAFQLSGPVWGTSCNGGGGADLFVTFDELLRAGEAAPRGGGRR